MSTSTGRASDAVRDQMMRHDPKWATFNSAYINEKVQFHLERVVADEPTDDCLIDLFTHMYDPGSTSQSEYGACRGVTEVATGP